MFWTTLFVAVIVAEYVSALLARQVFWGFVVFPSLFLVAFASPFLGGWYWFAPIAFGCVIGLAVQVDSGHGNQLWPFDR